MTNLYDDIERELAVLLRCKVENVQSSLKKLLAEVEEYKVRIEKLEALKERWRIEYGEK